MIIRDITPQDTAAIYETEKCSFPDPWSESGIAAECDNSLGIALAAEDEGIIAGYIYGEYDGERGYISHIAVAPQYRRQGMARALIAAFESRAEGDITLEVRHSNLAAVSLYKSAGFSEAGIRKNFYSVPEKEDAVVMIKTLSR